MPSAIRSKARRAFSHAGRSRRGARFRRVGGCGRCRPGASWAQGRRTGQPAQIRAPSGCASLSGGCTPRPGSPHRTGSPTPRPSTPDTPRPPATGSPGQNPAAAPQGLLPLRRAGVGAVLGCDDVVDPAVQDCDDEPVPDGEVTVELCCADPASRRTTSRWCRRPQRRTSNRPRPSRSGPARSPRWRLRDRRSRKATERISEPDVEEPANLRITTRTPPPTARSTSTNPPTCPTATTNSAPSTLKASNARCARSSRGLPGSLDGDFADGAGVGARAPG